jgi:hypothetical protein
VHEFCAVALQSSWHISLQLSSTVNCGETSGSCVGAGVVCGAFICGSSTVIGCAVFSCACTTGFVITSCVAGAQLIRNISAIIAHFIV